MHPASRPVTATVLNGLFVLTLCMLAYLGVIGFGTVWVRHRISVTANTTRALELQIADVQRQVNETSAELALLSSPEQLIKQNFALGLNLVRPREEQVIRVTEDIERRLATNSLRSVISSNDVVWAPER